MKYILSAYVLERIHKKELAYDTFLGIKYNHRIQHVERTGWVRKSLALTEEEGDFLISISGIKDFKMKLMMRLFGNCDIDNIKDIMIEEGDISKPYIPTNAGIGL